MSGPAVRQGDSVGLTLYSSFAARIVAHVTARLADGTYETLRVPEFTSGTALAEERYFSPGGFTMDGEIVDAVILNRTSGKKGQTYARLETLRGSGIQAFVCSGYAYGGRIVSYGMNEGMLEGHGHTRIVTVVTDEDGDNDTVIALTASNLLRKVRALVMYYNASSDVASRTMQLLLRRNLGNRPTGFATADQTWQSAILTLTQDQEGNIYVGENEGFVSYNDNGTVTYADNTTAPQPFPLWINEDDTTEIVFDVTLGAVADKYSIYLLVEEWINI